MADRYWVGGTASWDATAGTKWATTSGGAGGASVPTSADDVYFDAASGVVTCTIATGNTGAKSITCTGFTGTITGSANITLSGNLTLSSGLTFSHIGLITFVANATLTTFGKAVSDLRINATGITVQLADALTTAASRNLSIDRGTFTTNNYSVSVNNFFSDGANTRAINLGSSTVTVRSSGFQIDNSTGLTFNAGTSLLSMSTGNIAAPNGTVFYDVSFAANNTNSTITGSLVFNNLSFAGRTSAGVKTISTNANQTINGTLTLSAGTNATMRTFVRSNTIGETRTLTCAAVASLTDIDFRDITIAGAAAPVSGTRLGDCKGNSGITFDAAKTVYWRNTGGSNWGATGDGAWSLTLGGSAAAAAFPLAQDTAVFDTYPTTAGSTATINAAYNIGTIDMSARTSDTMTLACSQSPSIYGNWINGTGTTLSGTGTLTFAGRGSQTITSAGNTFTQSFTFDTPGGSVTLQDAFTTNRSSISALQHIRGTIDANGYNVTLSGALGGFVSNNSNVRALAIGSGTWTLPGTQPFNCTTSTNLTVTGTGTISLTSASAKSFDGGGIQTYPTLNQGGTGTLTITGSNKFADITNTAIGRVQFTGGTTNEFTAFNLNGTAGNLLALGSTNTTQATLQKSSDWLMGANSTNGGNNTNLTFSAGGGIDYLSVSYINGTVVAPFISAVILESASANTSESNIGTYNPTISELVSGADSISSQAMMLAAVSESSAMTDSVSAFHEFYAAIAEATTSSDVVSAAFTVAGSIAEQLNISEAAAAALVLNSLVEESAVVADEASRAMVFIGSVSELAAAAETVLAVATLIGQLTETATPADAAAVLASTFSASAAETTLAQDLLNAPGSIYSTGVAEAATAMDVMLGAYLWNDIPEIDENYSGISDTATTWSTIADNSETWNPED